MTILYWIICITWIYIEVTESARTAQPAVCGCLGVPDHSPLKINCGWKGITKHQCINIQGCCWKKKKNDYWCYHPANLSQKSNKTECEASVSTPLSSRVNCGWPGIQQDACECLGGCFDSVWHYNWCFITNQTKSKNLSIATLLTKDVAMAELWMKNVTVFKRPFVHYGVIVMLWDGQMFLIHKGNEIIRRCEMVIVQAEMKGPHWLNLLDQRKILNSTVEDFYTTGSDMFDDVTKSCGNAAQEMMSLP